MFLTSDERRSRFANDFVDPFTVAHVFYLQGFTGKQFGPYKDRPSFMDDQASQPAVGDGDPGQISFQTSGSAGRFEPQVEQAKTGDRHFLRKESDCFTGSFIFRQDGFLDRDNEDRMNSFMWLPWRKDLPDEFRPSQREELFLTQTPSDQCLLFLSPSRHLLQLNDGRTHRQIW